MFQSFLVLLLCFFTTASYAALNADLRVDYDSHNYNDAAKAAGGFYNYSHFRVAVGRLDYQGKLNDEVSYRVRLRFNTTQGAVTSRDSVNSTVDFAFVNHKFSDMVNLTVGKMATLVGGLEGNTTSADLYLPSETYGGTSVLGGYSGVTLQGTNRVHYSTGAQLGFNFAEGKQQLMLQVFNEEGQVGTGYGAANNYDSMTGGKFSQTQTLTGLVYRGYFMDKTLNLIASHHLEAPGSQDNKIALSALGIESKAGSFLTQLDFLKNDFQTNGATTPKQTLMTYVLNLKYSMDQWTPIFKVTFSEEKLDRGTGALTAEATNKYSGFALALEYKPKVEDNFRYHVAVYERSMQPQVGDERKETQAVVGMRLNADFLKN